MSRQPRARHEYASIQERALRSRPLRILGVNSMFPLITETYIHDELHSLEQLGAELAWFRQNRVPSPMTVSHSRSTKTLSRPSRSCAPTSSSCTGRRSR